ncbi:hypothetical protein V6U81_12395 [Micromonospora sp. CPCC 205711]|uniref:hypothetical protein n=1 Tax=Micromonospora sp. CPCC 205547 TaxID=3122400 RepID=UPI002FEEF979
MVYRYESDEDVFAEYPPPGSELSELPVGPPRPAGPSPSRFPTPSLPRSVPPPPLPAADPIPVHSSVQAPPPPPTHEYAPTEPLDLPRPRRTAPESRGGRLWQVLVGGAAVLALLGLCGIGAAALLVDRSSNDPAVEDTQQAAPAEQPSAADPSAGPAQQDLDSRDTDQQPLTAAEVFPGRKLVVADGQPAYEVLKTQSGGACAVAATGEISDLLVRLGCSQVVRATLRSPDGQYLITAGLFNLTDVASAQRARDRIRQLLDARQGRFRGMPADDDTGSIATAAARVGWQVRGHYIAYCLVTRADSGAVAAGDSAVRGIIYDLIERHLNRGVLDRRADVGSVVQPGAQPSAASTSPSQRRTTGSDSPDDTNTNELPGN